MMSYWTFSDVFEEQGVVKHPSTEASVARRAWTLPKPRSTIPRCSPAGRRAPRRKVRLGACHPPQRRLARIAVWNLFYRKKRRAEKFTLHFAKSLAAKSASVTIVDALHGSPLAAFEKMGRPAFPSREQIAELRKAGAMPQSKTLPVSQDSLSLTLEPHALALIELSR